MTKINGIEQTPKQMVTRLKKELRDIKHILKHSTDTLSISTAQTEAPLVVKELKYNQNLVKITDLEEKIELTKCPHTYLRLIDRLEELRIQNRDLY
jgi:hypothetical protein